MIFNELKASKKRIICDQTTQMMLKDHKLSLQKFLNKTQNLQQMRNQVK